MSSTTNVEKRGSDNISQQKYAETVADYGLTAGAGIDGAIDLGNRMTIDSTLDLGERTT